MDLNTSLISYVNDGILAEKSPATLKGYQYSLNQLFEYIKCKFLPQDTASLTTETISQFFIDKMKLGKWSKYTHWTFYRSLNAYCNYLIKRGFIKDNPMIGIPKPRVQLGPPKSFNEAEVMKILRTVANMPTGYGFTRIRNKAFISLLVYTGLRKSEAVNLGINDVDLVNGFLVVEHGKGDKRREIPLEKETLVPVLQEYLDHRNRLYKSSPWFFTGTFSGRGHNQEKMAVTTVDRLFWKLNSLCNLSKRLSPHKLRHSFAVLFLEKTNGDIYTLKELLGHANISTTCVYLTATRQKKVEAINKFKLLT